MQPARVCDDRREMSTAVAPPVGGTGAERHNVPVPLTPLIGRARELDGVAETLNRTRLVTLTGPGGVGKTRLAIELARRQIGRRADGVWLVDLTAGPADPDPAAEVARTLEVGGSSAAAPTESLRRYLAQRDVLLVIDNCERVIDACAELTSALLRSCGGLRILATSRESLGVNGETVRRLESLADEDAQRLFVERARQRDAQFIPDADADAAIAALCERLDRLPLAIELAAARIGAMSPAEILSDLESRLGGLGGGPRISPARHRTVRATVEWSYDLLDPAEQRAFRSLAVFVGGFDAEAALAVAPGLTVDAFTRLVDKSVVVARETTRGRTRYRLLETVREYAHDLLVESGELDAVCERHLRHFSALAASTEVGWPPFVTDTLLNERREDYENVRAALEWAAESDPCAGVALFAATRDLFQMLGQADGRRIAQLLLERCPARDRSRVEVLITAGILAMASANADAARACQREAREVAAELREPELEGYAALYHGLTQALNMAVEPARADLDAARDLHRRAQAPAGEAMATAALGLTFLMTGEHEHARELLEQAVAMQRAAGYRWGEGHASLYLGLTLDAVDPRAAAVHYRHAVECFRPFRDATLLPYALMGQAGLMARRDPATALRVTAAAWNVRVRVGGDVPPLFRELLLHRVREACEAALGDDAKRIWTEGTRLDLDDAIALTAGTQRPRLPAPAGLSARELDVVRLVAKGLANKAIAAQLHLSVRTVETHVRHVLAKACLQNRTQLATWAREHIQ
jgi:predicted ATPase/DNA-binding CsgD family transcriptional regulator